MDDTKINERLQESYQLAETGVDRIAKELFLETIKGSLGRRLQDLLKTEYLSAHRKGNVLYIHSDKEDYEITIKKV